MTREDQGVFAGARTLVTGATGFVGRHVCRRLASLGAVVHGVSRSRQDNAEIAFHLVDLTDAGAVKQLIETVQPHYVFHLASHVSGARDRALVRPTLESNLLSTINLLDALVETDCRRYVLAGSLEETDPQGTPTSPYAAAKSAGTLYARMYHALYDVPITIARLFMVYGPDQPDTRKLVPYVTLSLLEGKSPQLGSGDRPVDWVHVHDVADALLGCALSPAQIGQTVDIGTGRLTSVRSVAERISKLVGRGEPVFGAVPDRALEQVRAADPTSAERLLGHRFMDLEQGLANTVDWYREHSTVAHD